MDGFKILSEFHFDVGNALVSSDKLQNAVEGVAGAANQANLAFQNFSSSLVAQFDLMNFSVLKILKSSLDATDSFQESAKGFAQTMAMNMNYLHGPIQTFNDKLAVSRSLLDEMTTKALRIGISPNAMVEATHSIASTMIPMGLAGTNFRNAQNLGALGVQAGKPLGMSASSIGKDISNMLSGSKEGGGALFSALVGSTKTFKEFKDNVEEFTSLSGPEKIKVLSKGLKELQTAIGSTGHEIVTFSDITDRLKDMVTGLGSVLRPIGDAIFPVLLNSVKQFSDRFQEIAPLVGRQIGSIIKDLVANPKDTMLNLMSARHLGSDFSKAKDILSIVGIIDIIAIGLKKVGIIKGGLGAEVAKFIWRNMLAGLSGSFNFVKGMISFEGLIKIKDLIIFVFKSLRFAMTALGVAVFEILFPLAFIITIFQTLHKALAIVEFEKTVSALKNIPEIINSIHRIQNAAMEMMAPFLDFIDVFSKLIAQFILGMTAADSMQQVLDKIASVFEFLGMVMVSTMAALNGFAAGIVRIAENFGAHRSSPLGNGVINAMDQGMDDYIARHVKGVENGKVANQIQNFNGGIVIKNDFKDQVDPDRIAYTIKEQILKAHQNKTHPRSGSLQKGWAK